MYYILKKKIYKKDVIVNCSNVVQQADQNKPFIILINS